MAEDIKWYAIHTYSGYENKVKANIEKSVENRGLHDLILDIRVPLEDVIEQKGEEKKVVKRKVFPGYVVIKMIMTDDSWYVVRNTRGVTGFVGPGSKPVALTEDEVERMGIEQVKFAELGCDIGDVVKIIAGPLDGFTGVIEEINAEKQKVCVCVSMFGRDTPVELDYHQIKVMD